MRSLLILLFLPGLMFSKTVFDMNADLLEAQRCLAQLRLQLGNEILNTEQRRNPNNVAVDLIRNYYDMYRVLLTRNKALYENIVPNRKIRLQRLEQSDLNQAEIVFAQTELYMQWAFIKSMYGDYLSSAMDFREANSLVDAGLKRFPGYLPLLKNKAILETVIGMLPDQVHWLVEMIGFSGTLQNGMEHMQDYLRKEKSGRWILDRQNVQMMYCFMLPFVNTDKEAMWKEAQAYFTDSKNNLMEVFLKAYMAQQCNRNEEAISVLQQRPNSKEYAPFYYLDYMLGNAKLNRLDADAAPILAQFIKNSDYESIYADTYKKLAWLAWMQDDTVAYFSYKKLEKKNRKEAETSYPFQYSNGSSKRFPDKVLLQARLLCDGGYYVKSIETLSRFRLKSDTAISEYYYRLGRNQQELNQYVKAIQAFQKSIQYCPKEGYSFMYASELQLGMICKKLHLLDLAKTHLKKASQADGFEHAAFFAKRAKMELESLQSEKK